MKDPRELYYATLFDRVAGAAEFKVKERRVRHWSEVVVEDMPYIGMAQDNETPVFVRGLPYKWTLRATLYVYVHTAAQQDKAVVPSQILNPILDAIEAVLAPTDEDESLNLVNTLGGVVDHCCIAGTIETSEGMLGDIEYALIPVEIVVPS